MREEDSRQKLKNLIVLSGDEFEPTNKRSEATPYCLQLTGKKPLEVRTHLCQHCGFEEDRDVAAAMIVEYRGNIAVGQPVNKNACGDGLTGAFKGNLLSLVKNR